MWLTIDGELASSQSSDHEETGAETAERSTETKLTANLEQTGEGALTGLTLGLVDLGKHGVGGLRDDGGGETGDETGTEVGKSLSSVGELLLGPLAEDGLSDLLVHDELGHGVRDPRKTCVKEGLSSGSLKRRATYCLKQMGPKPA